MMDQYNSLQLFMMLNIARLLYSMLCSFRELRALPVLAQSSFMSDQYGSVFLFAYKILVITSILNDTKIHNTAEVKAHRTNKEIFLTYNFV